MLHKDKPKAILPFEPYWHWLTTWIQISKISHVHQRYPVTPVISHFQNETCERRSQTYGQHCEELTKMNHGAGHETLLQVALQF